MLVRKARWDQLEDLEGEKLMDAAAYIVQDPTLLGIRQQLIDSQVSQLMIKNGVMGENHPEVLRLRGAVDELASVDSALTGLKAGIKADYEVARQKFEALRKNSIASKRPILLPKAKIICLRSRRAQCEHSARHSDGPACSYYPDRHRGGSSPHDRGYY